MKHGKFAAAIAALGLIAAPAMAEASVQRSSSPTTDESSISSQGQIAIGVLFALIALAIGIGIGGNDSPVSP